MDLSLLLNVAKYFLFSLFLVSGALVFYRATTPKETRESHRLRFKEQIQSRAKKTEKKVQNITFEERLREAGLPFLNTYRFELGRLVVLILFICNYWILPVINGAGFDVRTISLLLVIWLITEHRFKIPVSITNMVINMLIAKKKRERSIELFTLYDVLKTELSSLQRNQSVNVYNLLKDSLPMFRYIDGTLSRFLSTLLTNSNLAERILHEEIKTQGSKTLGEILVKIDNLNRDEALEIIQTESATYSGHYFKEEFRKGQKKKNRLQLVFSVNVLFNAAWLIIFLTNMLMLQLNNVNGIL